MKSAGRSTVDVYEIGRDRVARLAWSIAPPHSQLTPMQFSLDGRARPDVCVIWAHEQEDTVVAAQLRCYTFGSSSGSLLPVTGTPSAVSLAPDGAAVVWVTDPSASADHETQVVVTARYDSGNVSRVRNFPVAQGNPPGFTSWGCETYVNSALWLSPRQLVLECNGENDFPGGLVIQDVSDSERAKKPGRRLPDSSLESPGAAYSGVVLALRRTPCRPDCLHGSPDTAVEVRTAGGESRIATALAGRTIVSISGGPKAIVYVTDDFSQRTGSTARVYIRRAGDPVGLPVIGLPSGLDAGVDTAVLQP